MANASGHKAQRSRFTRVRWAVLIGILVVSTVLGLLHQKAPELRVVSVDALCPFGGIESLWTLMASGSFIKKVGWGSVILLVGAVGVNLVFGRAFCGQFCPLGTLQELMSALRRRLRIARREVPAWLDVPARFIKYAVFGIFTWLAWFTASLVIRPYDPWAAYHHLTSAELFTSFGVGAAVLGVSLVGSFVYDRFFCKYLCPMGAFLGLFSRLGWYRVERAEDACTDCGACNRVCPANIPVSTAGVVADAECLACAECVAACPAAGALTVRGRSGSSVTPVALTLATLAIMLGLVFASTAFGGMSFTLPSLKAQSGLPQAAGVGTAPSGATFDVSLIKGYMTMTEVAEATGIPAQEFAAQFGVSDAEMTQPLKDVKNAHDWDTQAVRDYVAQRLGVPTSAPDSCQ